MDAIDLLLIASKSESNLISDPCESRLDESCAAEHLDAINAILALSTQVSNGGAQSSSISIKPEPNVGSETDQTSQKSNVLQPERTRPVRRPRAMSEPWTTDYIWQSPVSRHASAFNNKSSYTATSTVRNSKEELKVIANRSVSPSSPVTAIGGGAAAQSTAIEKYASIYNKNGRIGIYTKEERAAIIRRYRDKKKRRVWKKQIRYYCRKNLADRRIRIKGRFVKANEMHLFTSGSLTAGGAANSGEVARSSKLNYLVDVLHHINEDDDEEEDEDDDEDDIDEEDIPMPPVASTTPKRVRRHSIAY